MAASNPYPQRVKAARVLLAALLLAGCGGAPQHVADTRSPTADATVDAMGRLGPLPSATPGAACLTAGERGGVVRFRSGNGASIAGVVLGTGRVGVVMAHSNKGMWNLLLLPPPTVVIRLAETPMDLSTSATACARLRESATPHSPGCATAVRRALVLHRAR
jgi:hypothetical protein